MKSTSSIALIFLMACGGKAASTTTPTSGGGDITTWLATCIGTANQAEVCSQVAVSPDGKQVALAFTPDDSGRGYTSLSVAIIDVASHKTLATHVIVEASEASGDGALTVTPAATTNINTAASKLKGWMVQTPVAATLGNVPAGEDEMVTANISINDKAATVGLPDALGCASEEGEGTDSDLEFKGSALKATVLAGGKIAMVHLGGGTWPDMCSPSGPRIWVGSL